MMTYLKRYIALLVLCGTLSQCEMLGIKPKNELPPETQEGKNTFGFLLNGEVWRPEGRAGLTNNFQPYLRPYGGEFSVGAYKKKGDIDQSIGVAIRNLTNIGIYTLDGYNGIIGFGDISKSCEYNWGGIDKQQGIITITKYDREKFIVSGRFEAVLVTKNCDTIKITQGRFDVKFD